jgi:hypothetical protein
MTRRRSELLLLISVLVSVSIAPEILGQDARKGTTQLIKRYEQRAGLNRIVEGVLEIRLEPDENKRRLVAIRVCSKQTLPFSLFRSEINPFVAATYLKDFYAYPPENIFFVRSEQCISPNDSNLAAAEIWMVSNKESLPENIESFRSDEITRFALGNLRSKSSAKAYRVVARELIEKLRSEPDSKAVIVGYYSPEPTSSIRSRIQEIELLLKQSGFPASRYCAFLSQWTVDDSDYANSKSRYPTVFIVRIKRDSPRAPRAIIHQ